MKTSIPRTVRSAQNHTLNYAGASANKGGSIFIDHAQNVGHELFEMRATHTGPHYALCEVVNNPELKVVRVDHTALNGKGPIRLDDTLLAGPITYPTPGPRAKTAWLLSRVRPQAAKPKNKPQDRKVGSIVALLPGGNAGFISTPSGEEYFVHRSQMNGVALQVGTRCSFLPVVAPKGPAAISVVAA